MCKEIPQSKHNTKSLLGRLTWHGLFIGKEISSIQLFRNARKYTFHILFPGKTLQPINSVSAKHYERFTWCLPDIRSQAIQEDTSNACLCLTTHAVGRYITHLFATAAKLDLENLPNPIFYTRNLENVNNQLLVSSMKYPTFPTTVQQLTHSSSLQKKKTSYACCIAASKGVVTTFITAHA